MLCAWVVIRVTSDSEIVCVCVCLRFSCLSVIPFIYGTTVQIIPSCHSLYSDIMRIAALFLPFVIIYSVPFGNNDIFFFLLGLIIGIFIEIYTDIYHMCDFCQCQCLCLMICLCLLFCYTRSMQGFIISKIRLNLEYESRVYNTKKIEIF